MATDPQNFYLNVLLRSVLGLLSIAGNGLVVFVILRNKSLLKDGFNVLLLQLALGDFFIGFGNGLRVLEALLSHFNLLVVTPLNCFLIELPLLIGMNLSQLIMFLIAVDRFISIRQLKGIKLINNKIFSWVRAGLCTSFAVLVSLGALIELDTTIRRSDPGSTVTPVVKTCHVTMGWSDAYLGYFSAMTTFFSFTIVGAYALTFVSYWLHKKKVSASLIHREQRIAQTLILIVLAYLFCWCLPRLITSIHHWLQTENAVSKTITGSIGYLGVLNSVLNVAIYGCKHRQIRIGMVAFLGLASSKYVTDNRIFTTVSSTKNNRVSIC